MQSPSHEPGSKPSPRSPWGIAFSAGIGLVVSVLVGIFAGNWADKRFGIDPWGSLGGFFLGVTVGLYQLIRQASLPPNGGS
ncbi:AtpZ/AtpI family protein [Elusimicrobiota bacterium]